jgi:hypothetical protein
LACCSKREGESSEPNSTYCPVKAWEARVTKRDPVNSKRVGFCVTSWWTQSSKRWKTGAKLDEWRP